nr:hypothetical protein [Tanacetum cinerariifolium]
MVKSASTPIEIEKPLLKDPDGKDVECTYIQTVVANSSTEAEYVAVASCYAQYALMVNPTIYVSCIKQFWATTSIKKTNDVVKLQALIDRKKVVVTEDVIHQDLGLDDADGLECLPTEEIFAELALQRGRRETNSVVPWPLLSFALPHVENLIFLILINNQVDDLCSHTTRYTSPALTQKLFANMRWVGKGFLGVETPLFATMIVQAQPQAAKEEEEDEEQHTETSKSSMTLLHTLMEKRMHPNREGKIKEIDDDEDVTLVDMETQVDLGVELKGRITKDDDNVVAKEVSAAEPTVFDDEEVTITMAQTLIKMKAKKARILDEQMAKRLHDEEVE